jgi:endonuclease/exonuclease/phosphatase (EEP) superfamily protein YafD
LGSRLRILSANLLNGGADIAAFTALVDSLDVDVMALQELAPDHADAVSETLPHGELAPHHNYIGMALMARRAGVVERVPLSWGFGQNLRLEPEHWPQLRETVVVTNLHVAAPQMVRPAPGLVLRRRMIGEIEAHLRENDLAHQSVEPQAPDEPERRVAAPSAPARVLVGDFNATPYWPLYRRIASQFTDASVTVEEQTGRRSRATWGPWPGAPKLFRIDHGFVRGLGVEDFRVFDVAGSDHRALVMDLSLP